MLFRSRPKQVSFADVKGDVDRLAADVRSLLSAKELDDIPEIKRIRHRIDTGVSNVRESAAQALYQTRQAAIATDEYAREEPWRVAGAALAVGVVLGFMLSRR